MKKLIFGLMTTMLLLTISPSFGNSPTGFKTIPAKSTEVPVVVTELLTRLDDINAMDKSSMSSSEKKALRSEVKEIKATLKENSGGAYISVGALIIIILLLLILL